VGADRLRPEIKCGPELVAGVRGVPSELYPVVLAVTIHAADARLYVVLSHEPDYMDDLYGHVVAVVQMRVIEGIMSHGCTIFGPAKPCSSGRKFMRFAVT
jgi:hypothetical protein